MFIDCLLLTLILGIVIELIFQFGLFGFAGMNLRACCLRPPISLTPFTGGITNWLAIKMLFDEVPGLYGSGVIPKRFKEIRQTVKNVILGTFFDEVYLKKYLNGKAKSFLEGANLGTYTQLAKQHNITCLFQ